MSAFGRGPCVAACSTSVGVVGMYKIDLNACSTEKTKFLL